MEDIIEREGRAVIGDLVWKGRRVRTVPVLYSVKQTKGPLLRSVSKSGKLGETLLRDWSIWSVVESCAKEIVKQVGPHDFAAPAQNSAGNLAETWSRERIKFLLGHSSIQTTELYSGSEQEIAVVVNDRWSL